MTKTYNTYQECIDDGESILECVQQSAKKVVGKLKPEDDVRPAWGGGKRRRKSRRKTKSKRARKSLAPKAHMNATRSSRRY